MVENKNGPFLWDNLLWNLICLGHREIHATGSHGELAGLGIDSLFYVRQNGFQFVYMISMSECHSCFLFPAKGDTMVINTSGGSITGARPCNKSNLIPPHEKHPLISCIQQRKSAAPNMRLDVGPSYYYYYYHYQRHYYYQLPLLLPAYPTITAHAFAFFSLAHSGAHAGTQADIDID